MTGTCKACRFAQDFDGAGSFYECRRNAPTAGASTEPSGASRFVVWPIMAARDWCGQFEAPMPEKPPARPRGRPRKYAQGPQHREAPPRPIRDIEVSGVTA